MGKFEKLVKRLKSKPKDLTFAEVEVLLGYLGYYKNNKGKTSGSRISFINDYFPTIILHKPHPRKELLEYQVKQLLDFLIKEELI